MPLSPVDDLVASIAEMDTEAPTGSSQLNIVVAWSVDEPKGAVFEDQCFELVSLAKLEIAFEALKRPP